LRELLKEKSAAANSKRLTTGPLVQQSQSDGGDVTYYIYNGNIAVFQITSFEPQDVEANPENQNEWDSFRRTLENAVVDAVVNRNIKDVVVDVTGNGGGYVCLAYATLRFLSAAFSGTALYEGYDYRISPISDQLVDSGAEDGSTKLILGTENPYPDNSWYSPATTETRGGEQGSFTPRWGFYCGTEDQPPEDTFWIENAGHYFKKIAIISDGTCGSACNYFVTKFVVSGAAFVLSYGGITGQVMDSCSFAGGDVEDWQSWIEQDLQGPPPYDFYDSMNPAPLQLPTSAATRFNFAEVYYPGETNPREFNRYPANKHVDTFWGYTDTAGKVALTVQYGGIGSSSTRVIYSGTMMMLMMSMVVALLELQ